VLTAQVSLPLVKYREPAQQIGFVQNAIDRVNGLPGVESSGVSTLLPFVGDFIEGFVIDGRPEPRQDEAPSAIYYAVTPSYFETMQIPLRDGRYFTDRDRAGGPRVVIINETLARRFFPDESPLGKRIRFRDGASITREIVGVVGDVRQYGVESGLASQIYEPYVQNPLPFITLTIKTAAEPSRLSNEIRSQVLSIDRGQPVSNVKTMEQIVSDSIAQQRLTMILITVFAVVAIGLASVGLYGVMAYSVARQTRENGIRIALGAEHGDIMKLVLGRAIRLGVIGLLLGFAGAFAAGRLGTRLLFGVGAADPVTYCLTALLLFVVVVMAGYLPARRAARIDPIVALRYE
jgi:putative ABC transport system permease protein